MARPRKSLRKGAAKQAASSARRRPAGPPPPGPRGPGWPKGDPLDEIKRLLERILYLIRANRWELQGVKTIKPPPEEHCFEVVLQRGTNPIVPCLSKKMRHQVMWTNNDTVDLSVAFPPNACPLAGFAPFTLAPGESSGCFPVRGNAQNGNYPYTVTPPLAAPGTLPPEPSIDVGD